MATAVGELKGLLQGIQTMMSTQDANMNRRIDDMHHSNTKRLDDLGQALNQRLQEHQTDLADVKRTADAAHEGVIRLDEQLDGLRRKAGKTGAVSGAGVGGIVAVGIEFAKAYFLG